MDPAQDASGITDALTKALGALKEGQQAQEEIAGKTVEVEGADGQIRASATLAGKVKVEIIDPRAVRLGAEVLGEEITRAVNAALDAAREQAGLPGAVDLDALSGKLEELQQQSTQRLTSFMDGLAAAHAQIVRASGESR